jgi:tRNA U34 2-thiouridine synthase MnmA/TrmU
MNRKRKAFSLLSGGLDSLLATRLIMAQGIEIVGLHFITPFFGYGEKGRETAYIERMRSDFGIEARVIDVGEEYFQILRHPRYGYGKNFNPCVDCKVFLFSKARTLLEEEKADFLVTGEVLGQRPMSQRRDTLRIVERDSKTDGLLLRPLCAKNLKPTQPEILGIVDREKLLGLSGRGRKPQMRLAEEFGIKNYPAPAGGCVLTDPILAKRIRNHFARHPMVTVNEILRLQVGRHFIVPDQGWLVLGRDEEENNKLEELWEAGDHFLIMHGIPGPSGSLRGNAGPEQIKQAAAILAHYSKAKNEDKAEVIYGPKPDLLPHRIIVQPAREEQIASLKF